MFIHSFVIIFFKYFTHDIIYLFVFKNCSLIFLFITLYIFHLAKNCVIFILFYFYIILFIFYKCAIIKLAQETYCISIENETL